MKPICRLSDEPVQLVADLIDEHTGNWNSGLVRSLFLAPVRDTEYPKTEVDTRGLLGVGLGQIRSVCDSLSVYRELKERQQNSQGVPGSSSGGEESWGRYGSSECNLKYVFSGGGF